MIEDVVLLHGFGGTRDAWAGVEKHLPAKRYRPLALDLPGHGELADASRPITFAKCVASVLERSPKRFVLGGYSMGGRIALHVALQAPQQGRAPRAGVGHRRHRGRDRKSGPPQARSSLRRRKSSRARSRSSSSAGAPSRCSRRTRPRSMRSRAPTRPQRPARSRGGPARHRHRRDAVAVGEARGAGDAGDRRGRAIATASSCERANGWSSCCPTRCCT